MDQHASAIRSARLHSMFIKLALFLTCIAVPGISAAAVEVSGRIDAKVTNPGIIIVDNGSSFSLTPPDDQFNAAAATSSGGPVYDVQAKVVSELSNFAFGLGGSVSATSAVGVGSLRSGVAGGYIDFDDEIQILSPSLPDGTPVDVQFSFFSAQDVNLFHDAPGLSNNASGATFQFTANLNSSVNGANNIYISNGDNRVGHLFGSPPTFETGIMNVATPQLDVIYSGVVGETVSVHLRALASIGVAVWSSGVGQVDVHSGTASGAVAISFGASPLVGDVTLQSQMFGGSFPGLAQANFSNANMALSSFTPIPLPPMVYAFAAALLGLFRLSRRSL